MPFKPRANILSLEQGAQCCQRLTVIIGFEKAVTNHDPDRPSGGRASRVFQKVRKSKLFCKRPTDSIVEYPYTPDLLDLYKKIERQTWTSILRNFINLSMLTLRVNGDPGWRGRHEPERTLNLLRLYLEDSDIKQLRHIDLSPIHGMGILHLRWDGFGACTEIPHLRGMHLWQSITNLSIRLRNPLAQEGKVSTTQYITFLKVLNDYFRSFSRNLLALKFVWLDREGPDPLSLHLEQNMEHQGPLQWPILEEFWFGNLKHPNRTLAMLPDRAPGVNIVKILRNIPAQASTDSSIEETWMDVPPSQRVTMQSENIVFAPVSDPDCDGRFSYPSDDDRCSIDDGAIEIDAYDPTESPSITPIRPGRADLIAQHQPPATSRVYPEQSEATTTDADLFISTATPSQIISMYGNMIDREADDFQKRIARKPLVDRGLLATSSVYPPESDRDPYKSGISTMASDDSDLCAILTPALFKIGVRKS